MMRRNVAFLLINFSQRLFSQKLFIKYLQQNSDDISSFRSLERLVRRLARAEASLDFLQLCSSFGVKPTFVRLDKNRHRKWKKSSESFEDACLQEEIKTKVSHIRLLSMQVADQFTDIRSRFTLCKYLVTLRIISSIKSVELARSQAVHQKKRASLLTTQNIEEHIDNRSSYSLSYMEKLVLSRGLNSSFPHKANIMKIRTSFDRTTSQLSRLLNDRQTTDKYVEQKELLVGTMKSICEEYCNARTQMLAKPLR